MGWQNDTINYGAGILGLNINIKRIFILNYFVGFRFASVLDDRGRIGLQVLGHGLVVNGVIDGYLVLTVEQLLVRT